MMSQTSQARTSRMRNNNEGNQTLGSGRYEGGDIVLRREGGRVYTNVPHVLVYHSPTGFEWGYGGSGPADLALNILALFVDKKTAFELYQDFKWEFVARVPRDGGVIRREVILAWLREKGAAIKC